ncbi:hypothetical protein BDZ97DRAFT_1825194, partial [Flammula alnicola]
LQTVMLPDTVTFRCGISRVLIAFFLIQSLYSLGSAYLSHGELNASLSSLPPFFSWRAARRRVHP